MPARRRIRRRRAHLSQGQLADAELAIARQATALFRLNKAQVVLSYLPTGGEISPARIIQQLPHANVLLPRISHFADGKMQFYPRSNGLIRNRFGIYEPATNTPPVSARMIDAVLLPLVAFDRSGNRIGMGGGFYDRAFGFCLDRHTMRRPLLVGLAHHFQEVETISRQSWDVPLDVILTDRELIDLS